MDLFAILSGFGAACAVLAVASAIRFVLAEIDARRPTDPVPSSRILKATLTTYERSVAKDWLGA
jgi:hypothetical protein